MILEKHLAESGDRSVRSFIRKIDVEYMKLPVSNVTARSFININYPSGLTGLYP